MKLPRCSGSQDYWGEYDCESAHEETCENCLCNYHDLGGRWNSNTGKLEGKIMAFLKYGPRRPWVKTNKEERVWILEVVK